MAQPVITVTVDGMERVFAFTDRLESAQWDNLLETIGATIEEQTINHFQEQAGPDGPWAPTARGGTILVLTGTLRGSITHQKTGPLEMTIGNQTYAGYGRFHQEGTSRMVARKFLGLTASDSNELEGKIENYIERLVDGI